MTIVPITILEQYMIINNGIIYCEYVINNSKTMGFYKNTGIDSYIDFYIDSYIDFYVIYIYIYTCIYIYIYIYTHYIYIYGPMILPQLHHAPSFPGSLPGAWIWPFSTPLWRRAAVGPRTAEVSLLGIQWPAGKSLDIWRF